MKTPMKILTRDDTDHNTEYVTREDAEHEMDGWENKWKCAVDMAARAQLDAEFYRDLLHQVLVSPALVKDQMIRRALDSQNDKVEARRK